MRNTSKTAKIKKLMITLLQHIAEMSTAAKLLSPFLAELTNGPYGRAYATVFRLSVVVCLRRMYMAKWCVLKQKLLLTAYRKSYMRNRLVP